MWNKSNLRSINTVCTHYISSELHPSLPHLLIILSSILCFLIIYFTLDPAWKAEDSSEQIKLQEYFTAAFKEPTEITSFCQYMDFFIKRRSCTLHLYLRH